MRASVDVGFEEMLARVDKLEVAVRAGKVAAGATRVQAPSTSEVLAELKRLSAIEQLKGEQVDQWARVMVDLSGADRRRYWRLMRVVYRFARQDAHRARTQGRRRGVTWWQVALLATLGAVVLVGVMTWPIG